MGKVRNCILIFLYLDEIDGKSTVFFEIYKKKDEFWKHFCKNR